MDKAPQVAKRQTGIQRRKRNEDITDVRYGLPYLDRKDRFMGCRACRLFRTLSFRDDDTRDNNSTRTEPVRKDYNKRGTDPHLPFFTFIELCYE